MGHLAIGDFVRVPKLGQYTYGIVVDTKPGKVIVDVNGEYHERRDYPQEPKKREPCPECGRRNPQVTANKYWCKNKKAHLHVVIYSRNYTK